MKCNSLVSIPEYLVSSTWIDWQHPEVLAQARVLSQGIDDPLAISERCFVFVRDKIKHSADYQLNPVTCRASDVLREGTGFCYAKSHLLAALLRANQIPTGLCYQRLLVDENIPNRFCIHGLNAAYFPDIGWYRFDPRGNKSGVMATFCPPVEKLAFAITAQGESDLAEVWPEPKPEIIDLLTRYSDYQAVIAHVPDT